MLSFFETGSLVPAHERAVEIMFFVIYVAYGFASYNRWLLLACTVSLSFPGNIGAARGAVGAPDPPRRRKKIFQA